MAKKGKKILSILLCAVLSASYLTFLGGSGLRDEVLVNAEELTKQLFLSNDKEFKGTMTGYYVKGLDEEKDYILVTCNTGGYAIYDKEEYYLVEYSPYGTSPYETTDKEECYYAGPASYYEKDEESDGFKHVHKQEKLEKEQAKEISKAVKEKIKEIKKADKEKAKAEKEAQKEAEKEQKKEEKENKKDNTNDLNALLTEELVETPETPASSSVGEIVGGTDGIYYVDTLTAEVRNTQYVPGKEYFKKHVVIGDNKLGSCVTVAVTMLLGYNNWYNDSRLITEHRFLDRYALRPVSIDEETGEIINLYPQVMGVGGGMYEYYMNPSVLLQANKSNIINVTVEEKKDLTYIDVKEKAQGVNSDKYFYLKAIKELNLNYEEVDDLWVKDENGEEHSNLSDLQIQNRIDNADTFFEHMLWRINPDPGAYVNEAADGINGYLDYIKEQYHINNCVEDCDGTGACQTFRNSFSLSYTNNKITAISMINNEINAGRPVYVSMYTQNDNGGPHAVAVYGRQQVMINNVWTNGFIAHMGWKDGNETKDNMLKAVWFSEEWVRASLSFRTSHAHEFSNYKYEKEVDGVMVEMEDSHVHQCKDCGALRTMTPHTHDSSKKVQLILGNDTYHTLTCSCAYKFYGTHQWVYLQKEEKIAVNVDGEEQDALSEITVINSEKHIVKCASCGYENENADHFYKYEGAPCYYCNYLPVN